MSHFPIFADLGCSEAARLWQCLGTVFINFLYCRSLCPATPMRSGKVFAILSLTPNIGIRVVDLTQLFISSDSMISDLEGSVGNTLNSSCKTATGLQETASEALCHFPGQCWMVNLYISVFYFILNNQGFGILLRSQSPNNSFSGSWSVTTMKLEQPMTNIQHFSYANTIAAVSPLIGAYLHLVSMQNLLSANIRRQPSEK